MTPYILVLYYSLTGSTEKMAEEIALGIEHIDGINSRIRTVPELSVPSTHTPSHSAPYVTIEDLQHCSGLLLGSPTRFGNIAAPLSHFLEKTTPLWQSGALIDKPAGCFTSSSSLHGGQESTLLSMMLPLLHHGCIFAGIPYSETHLITTSTGGTPYGPSHVSGGSGNNNLSTEAITICHTFGKRMAKLTLKMST